MLAIVGPTASGKSQVAQSLAEELSGEIISVDSMQVYRGMDIGTAKPTAAQRERVVHHLIDIVEPDAPFTVADAQRIGRAAIDADRRPTIISGGTGLAFRALVDPLDFPGEDPALRSELEELPIEALQQRVLEVDPTAGEHLDLANPRRVIRALEVFGVSGLTPSQRAATPAAAAVRSYKARYPFRAVGLDPGPALEARVVARFDTMLEAGLLDEVAEVAPRLGRTAAQAVGYKELLPVLSGERTIADARADAIAATLSVAGNQRTYFRRDPRIVWLEWDDDAGVRLERARRELAL